MKIANYKNGHATMEKHPITGMYEVRCVVNTELHDKVRCDTYTAAREYYAAFKRIAKNKGA
jgi:hypothetical protein